MTQAVALTVNGRSYEVSVEPRKTLADAYKNVPCSAAGEPEMSILAQAAIGEIADAIREEGEKLGDRGVVHVGRWLERQVGS